MTKKKCTTPKKIGAPSTYSEELVIKILNGLANGKSLVKLCKELIIDYSTVCDWLHRHPSFAERYTRARELQADYLAEEIIEISDDEKISSDSRRIRVDTRKWYAGKVRPKKYGDKQTLEHTGDKDKPVEIVVSAGAELAEVISLEQLEEIERRVLAKTRPE